MYAKIPMVPGPVTIPPYIQEALAKDYPSGQIAEDFLPFYASTSRMLGRLLGTENDVLIMTGEGMLALWAALKSTLTPNDRVVSVCNGVFGTGIADMAASLGSFVEKISLPYNHAVTPSDLERIHDCVCRVKPTLLTAVHCETPSGLLNPLQGLSEIKTLCQVPLFYTDVVSSVGGTPVEADAYKIDRALGGSQKCLSAPPSACFVSVSETAWQKIEEVGYQGYDALLPFKTIYQDGRCPYTPSWHGIAALHAACEAIFAEGMETVFARHREVARACQKGLTDLGLSLWPESLNDSSPTVTAAKIPAPYSGKEWLASLRSRGLWAAGSFGPMADTVFRLGHMGAQARMDLLLAALDVIETVIKKERRQA